MSELKRAASVAEYLEKRPHFATEEGRTYAAAFKPRADDVIIATFPKCGTTWMQQIVHGLRTSGDMDFGEITEAVPWVEMAFDLGLDLDAPQKGGFRAFKVHHRYDTVPKGGRYICVLRDPKDTALSFFNFMNGWLIEPGTVSADAFVKEVFLGDQLYGSYWGHLLTWWDARGAEDMLMVTFEDMKANLPGVVRQVAGFVGVEDVNAIDVATRQAAFSFMKAHETQFDDHLTAQRRNAALGLPEGVGGTKVSTGHVGGYKQSLSDEIIKKLDNKWTEVILPALGFDNYTALRNALSLVN